MLTLILSLWPMAAPKGRRSGIVIRPIRKGDLLEQSKATARKEAPAAKVQQPRPFLSPHSACYF
ncbi:MAG: hypothetical protein LBR73_04940 [Oscillospiraceae bacterium]|jgi:hypothetical protein|nr:hypothetical protein [Oscillospiraceae bacterium]